jgi:hypothetical protein
MNDWAKKLGDEVKKQQDQKTANDATFLETQRLKKEFGPTLWEGLVAEVENSCGTINQQTGKTVVVISPTPDDELKVRNENIPARQLTAHFDTDKAQLVWEVAPLLSGGSARGHYEVAVDSMDGKVKLYPLGPGGVSTFAPPSSFSEIAQHMLTALMRNY